MKPQQRWLLSAVVVALALVATVVGPLSRATPASATPSHSAPTSEEIAPSSDDSPSGPLTSKQGEGEVGPAAALGVSPAGCIGKTNDPHRSSHVPGTVNVTALTVCDYNVESLYIQVTLWRSRWYGWERIGGVDQGKRNYGWYKIDYNASSGQCSGETHDYQGRTYHESQEPTGTYLLNTRKTKRFTC